MLETKPVDSIKKSRMLGMLRRTQPNEAVDCQKSRVWAFMTELLIAHNRQYEPPQITTV